MKKSLKLFITQKTTILICILFIMPFIGKGQDSTRTKLEKETLLGFKGGFNKSIINGHEFDGSKTGYIGYEVYGSFFSNTSLSKNLYIENELLFSYTDSYMFIEIPLHLKYRIKNKFYILAGPKLDFITTNDHYIGQNGTINNYRFLFEPLGISGELGVQYDINKRFFAEVRYSISTSYQINDFMLEIINGRRNTLRIGIGINF